jgi:hypothetical protein
MQSKRKKIVNFKRYERYLPNNYKRRFGNGRRDNSVNKVIKYNFGTKSSTFGPGRRVINISSTVSVNCSSEQTISLFTSCIDGKSEWNAVNKNFKYFKVLSLNITFLPRQIFVTETSDPLYMLVNYDGTRTPHLRVQDNVKIIPNVFFRTRTYSYKMANVDDFKRGWYTESSMASYDNVLVQLHSPDNPKKFSIRFDVRMVCRGPTSPQEETKLLKVEEEDEEKSLSDYDEYEARKDNEVKEWVEDFNDCLQQNKGLGCATNQFMVIPESRKTEITQSVAQVILGRLGIHSLKDMKILKIEIDDEVLIQDGDCVIQNEENKNDNKNLKEGPPSREDVKENLVQKNVLISLGSYHTLEIIFETREKEIKKLKVTSESFDEPK